jgi:HSP20 family protein
MKQQMDWLSGGLARGFSAEPGAGVFPLMNVTEDKDNYYVRAELPGLKASELDISVTGDTVSLAGERKLTPENKKAQYHRSEREGGRFSRILSLPAKIDPDKVQALCTDGILTVTLPKAESTKPRQIVAKAS